MKIYPTLNPKRLESLQIKLMLLVKRLKKLWTFTIGLVSQTKLRQEAK